MDAQTERLDRRPLMQHSLAALAGPNCFSPIPRPLSHYSVNKLPIQVQRLRAFLLPLRCVETVRGGMAFTLLLHGFYMAFT